MSCLKCGRNVSAESCFCDSCLQDMEKYPVKPGTVVRIPVRPEPSAFRKASKRRGPTPEEQIKGLRQRIRVLTILLITAAALVCALAVPAYRYFVEERLLPGQNYSTYITTETSVSDDS